MLEDRDEIKKFFCENHQNNYKRQYRSNCIVLWSKDLFWSKAKIATFFLTKIPLKEKSAEPDQIKLAFL